MKAVLLKYLPDSFKKKIDRARFWFNVNLKLKPTILKQLSVRHANEESFKNKLTGFKILVPLIESKHYQYLHILAIAKSLQLRGAEVKILLCGESLNGCEIKSFKNNMDSDPCYQCRLNRKNIVPLFGLDTITLPDLLTIEKNQSLMIDAKKIASKQLPKIIRNGIELNQCIEDSIVRYYYGNLPNKSEDLISVRIAHTHTALVAAELSRIIDDTFMPNVVLNNMYCYSAWEPFFRYFKNNGNRFRSISISQFNYKSVIVDSFSLFENSNRYLRYLNKRPSKFLTDIEKELLYNFLNNRFSGQSQIFKDWNCFDESISDTVSEKLISKLNLDKKKRNIFLFSNIYWDIGMSDCAALYPNIIDWVLDTIELLKDQVSCHLYIKPHPGEVFDSSTSLKGVSQIIREKYPILPLNVTLIEPQEKINTYSLFPLIDLGIVFNGTLGLEMMLNQIPVISTGKTTFQGLGFAFEPNSRESYLDVLVDKKLINKPTQNELEVYAYFYFIKTLIPWTITNQAYADDFTKFNFLTTCELKEGKDKYLDHMINCITFPENTNFDNWK